MKTNRRDLLRGAAATGALAGTVAIAGCDRSGTRDKSGAAGGQSSSMSPDITENTIAEAEKLQGVSFTPAERAMMLEDLEDNLQKLANLRAMEMPNNLAPACVFNPRLPGKSIKAQRNTLSLKDETPPPLPESDVDIAYASVRQQGVWIRSGALTSVRLTNIYLQRLSEYDAQLNAFITPTPDLARKQAVDADKDLARGRDRGPLHGIPYGLKDLADTKGVATTWGANPYKDRIPEEDCEVARKLRLAGAVLLGKTACGAIAYGDQWFGARTRNPWNTREGSSGSSAGSAAAVAAGLCSFAIGTETLGSIVSPSERCGTVGLRPTFGRVSRAGMMALCWSLDKVGPICRSVEDTALVLSELNGYDADDPAASRIGFTYDGAIDLSALTVGYVPQWFEEGDGADREALDAMTALGVTLKEFTWPAIDIESLIEILFVESAAAFQELTLSGRDDELVWQDAEAWPNTWRKARFISAVDLVQMDRLRRKLMQELNAAFEGFDALIGPHYAGSALLATNMTGGPQLALRAGFAQTPSRTVTDETTLGGETFRTPRGISLWGGLFQEGSLIALGAALERELGVSRERPPQFS